MTLKSLKLPAGGEVGITVLVVAIVSLMILPLPPEVIDVLLGVNIAISVTLLMVTMYVGSIVSLSVFPSILLFTTLYRLSLNIASTKSILLHANAGDIIESFGELVVGGNLVVGLVVFLIITIVQFIVIAKGSERVAEVGARFTLDAMPGKQMSIDADLRANILTPDEARRKRATLAKESQLHGGMDGAMKFVKGDAIAGLIITLVNIVAGIAIGVMYHGMTAGDAANRFSILSVGDAMVSQIPSLLISVAAGVMITRVADDHDDGDGTSLGSEIARQLGGSHRALYFAAVLLIGFAAVPGFPAALFVLLSGMLAFAGYRLQKGARRTTARGEPVIALQRAGAKSSTPSILPRAPLFTCAIGVRVAPDLVARLAPAALDRAFDEERAKLQEEQGLPFPGITLWTSDALPASTCEILMRDVPQARLELPADQTMLPDAASDPALAGRCTKRGPAGGLAESYWIDDKAVPAGARVARRAGGRARDDRAAQAQRAPVPGYSGSPMDTRPARRRLSGARRRSAEGAADAAHRRRAAPPARGAYSDPQRARHHGEPRRMGAEGEGHADARRVRARRPVALSRLSRGARRAAVAGRAARHGGRAAHPAVDQADARGQLSRAAARAGALSRRQRRVVRRRSAARRCRARHVDGRAPLHAAHDRGAARLAARLFVSGARRPGAVAAGRPRDDADGGPRMSAADLRPVRIIAGAPAAEPAGAPAPRAARRGFDYAQLMRRSRVAPAGAPAPRGDGERPRDAAMPWRDGAAPSFERDPAALPDALGREAMARACAGADAFVNQVFAQRERVVRVAEALAAEIAALGGGDASGQWEISLPLDAALLPDTVLHLVLSRFDLRLRFETPDAATRHLLCTHGATLHARLDTLLAHHGAPRTIEIDVG
ncbi:Secretion system apparatus protein SsaV [Burkholderia pseudomallei]|nr:Secretion system apparatus protein SsaV [Burkholderia pseudomallei]